MKSLNEYVKTNFKAFLWSEYLRKFLHDSNYRSKNMLARSLKVSLKYNEIIIIILQLVKFFLNLWILVWTLPVYMT